MTAEIVPVVAEHLVIGGRKRERERERERKRDKEDDNIISICKD